MSKILTTSIVKTVLLQLALVPVNLILILLAPLVFAFVPKTWNRMPDGGLRLWDEYTYGINGDANWVDPKLSDHPKTEDEARSWKWRILWFIRNGNVLDHYKACRPLDVVSFEWAGNPDTSDYPNGCAGIFKGAATTSTGDRFECLYLIFQYGSSNKCLRLYLGYKLKELVEFVRNHDGALPKDRTDAPMSDILQRVMAFHPYKKFENLFAKR